MSDSYAKYREWRRTVPWTNAEIIHALRTIAAEQPNEFLRERYERKAEWIETYHRFNARMLSEALPYLIRVCNYVTDEGKVCGGRALYRYGNDGRCKTHKMHASQGYAERQRRFEVTSHAFEQNNNEFYDRCERKERLRKLHRDTVRQK